MSDRIDGLTVVFETPLHEEDAKILADAISQFRQVLSVDLKVRDLTAEYTASIRIRSELDKRFHDLLWGNTAL